MIFDEQQGAMPTAPPSPGNDWFSRLFGFSETQYDEVKKWIVPDIGPNGIVTLQSLANGKRYQCGEFKHMPLSAFDLDKLGDLVQRFCPGKLSVRCIVGDSSELHTMPDNHGALFQIASRLNCLESASPKAIPEDGVTGYVQDWTQGAACAVTCGPGAVFRNYFAEVDRGSHLQRGQTAAWQLNCLSDVCSMLKGDALQTGYFDIVAGFTFATDSSLERLNMRLKEVDLDRMRLAVRIGVLFDTAVTSKDWGKAAVAGLQCVTQVFCGICTITQSRCNQELWEPFMRVVLEGYYEATLLAGVWNAIRQQGRDASRRVFLVPLTGGALGGSIDWSVNAMKRAFELVGDCGLDVRIVSRAPVHPRLVALEWTVAKTEAVEPLVNDIENAEEEIQLQDSIAGTNGQHLSYKRWETSIEVMLEAPVRLGFVPVRDLLNKRVFASVVQPGMHAEASGVAAYDELVWVDGLIPSAATEKELYEALQRRPVTLRFSRGSWTALGRTGPTQNVTEDCGQTVAEVLSQMTIRADAAAHDIRVEAEKKKREWFNMDEQKKQSDVERKLALDEASELRQTLTFTEHNLAAVRSHLLNETETARSKLESEVEQAQKNLRNESEQYLRTVLEESQGYQRSTLDFEMKEREREAELRQLRLTMDQNTKNFQLQSSSLEAELESVRRLLQAREQQLVAKDNQLEEVIDAKHRAADDFANLQATLADFQKQTENEQQCLHQQIAALEDEAFAMHQKCEEDKLEAQERIAQLTAELEMNDAELQHVQAQLLLPRAARVDRATSGASNASSRHNTPNPIPEPIRERMNSRESRDGQVSSRMGSVESSQSNSQKSSRHNSPTRRPKAAPKIGSASQKVEPPSRKPALPAAARGSVPHQVAATGNSNNARRDPSPVNSERSYRSGKSLQSQPLDQDCSPGVPLSMRAATPVPASTSSARRGVPAKTPPVPTRPESRLRAERQQPLLVVWEGSVRFRRQPKMQDKAPPEAVARTGDVLVGLETKIAEKVRWWRFEGGYWLPMTTPDKEPILEMCTIVEEDQIDGMPIESEFD